MTLPSVVDTSQCEREPIHIPAAIQPHGALLAVLPGSAVVTHASTNLAEFLACDAADALGRSLAAIVGEEVSRALLDELATTTPESSQRVVGRDGRVLQLRSYRCAQRVGIDIEATAEELWQRPPVAVLQAVLGTFKEAASCVELCERAVRGLRAITGYDRVMAYRFGEDGHGEVIAEARAAHLEAYLGQRYPASDIPPQARRLYLMQRVGVIADSNYGPVPVLSERALDGGTPLDLTHSALRSVSPIHREFMRNMRTAASMTIGLAQTRGLKDGSLWGMLVCHHGSPRAPGLELRSYAAMIGQVISLLLDSQGAAELYAEREKRAATLRTLLDGVGNNRPVVQTLAGLETELLRLVEACGVLVQHRGESIQLGRVPEGAAAARLIGLLRPLDLTGPVAVDDLGRRFPALAPELRGCAGALLLPLGAGEDDAILWFRAEQSQTITWGGNPAKPATADPATGRINPRISFAAWKEVRRGHSLAWTATDRTLAGEFQQGIEAELARRTRLALELYDRIFESSPTALLLVNPKGAIRMLNRQAEELFGYDRRELLGRNLASLLSGPLRAEIGERWFVVDAAGGPQPRQRRALVGQRKDASEFPIELSVNPVESSPFVAEPMIQVSIIDLTARLDSERQKQHAQERLQSIAGHVPAMIGYWNRDLCCEFANEGYRSAFGLPPERIVGMSLRELLGERGFACDEPHVRGVLSGAEQRFERVVKRPDGTASYVDERYVADVARDGAIRGFYVLATDVTALRRATQELQAVNSTLTHTNAELEQFVYTASHDLRSPLRAIASLAQFILEDDLTLGTETLERMQTIRSRAQRMQNMLDDVLAYAHAGKDDHQSGTVTTLEALVAELVTALDLPTGFTLDRDPSLGTTPVCPVPISQVLANLIGNAVKHHDRPQGTIRVTAEDRGAQLRISVADDGPGIPERYAETVFEMFSTLKPRDTVEGTGMGLALVRKIVRRLGGSCGIEPHPGRGTKVWFDWPKIMTDEGED